MTIPKTLARSCQSFGLARLGWHRCSLGGARDYVRAESISHAARLLADHKESACIIAGGQSLMTAMNFRMYSPEMLVDIGEIEALRDITLIDNAATADRVAHPPRGSVEPLDTMLDAILVALAPGCSITDTTFEVL